jgi:putative tryptophan/tyrosine transport system substrate-binding protein
MRRREFISLLSGAAIAWPVGARAQRPEGVRRLGVLMAVAENDPMAQPWVTALQDRLDKLGWHVGRNLHLDYRWSAGSFERMQVLASELVSLDPDVLLAGNNPTATALQRATRSIPIVFLLADPAGSGLVTNLAHPDGNITGFIALEAQTVGKQLELLREIAPTVRRTALLSNPADGPYVPDFLRIAEAAAPSLGLEIVPHTVRNAGEIETVINSWSREANVGLYVLPGTTTLVNRRLVATLAAQHRLPAVCSYRFFVTAGCLACYGPDITEQYRQAAQYIDKILKGAKPSELPVQTPTKYEMLINLATAKAIGLEISPTLLNRADEVVE